MVEQGVLLGLRDGLRRRRVEPRAHGLEVVPDQLLDLGHGAARHAQDVGGVEGRHDRRPGRAVEPLAPLARDRELLAHERLGSGRAERHKKRSPAIHTPIRTGAAMNSWLKMKVSAFASPPFSCASARVIAMVAQP